MTPPQKRYGIIQIAAGQLLEAADALRQLNVDPACQVKISMLNPKRVMSARVITPDGMLVGEISGPPGDVSLVPLAETS